MAIIRPAHASPRVPAILRQVAVAAMLVASLGGGVSAQGRAAAPPPPNALVAKADLGRITGAPNAPIWMLVVSDFQCPFCKQWHDSTWEPINRDYVQTGKIRVAYVNYPLAQHRNARAAALVAMCASAQGKFWPTADRLFKTQTLWENLPNPTAYFDGIAKAMGVDLAAEHSCITDPGIGALVDADRTRMTRAGTQSTPTFFIGNTRIEGAQPLALFRRAIESELAASGKAGARKP